MQDGYQSAGYQASYQPNSTSRDGYRGNGCSPAQTRQCATKRDSPRWKAQGVGAGDTLCEYLKDTHQPTQQYWVGAGAGSAPVLPQRSYHTSRRAEIRQALHPEPSPDYSLESYDGKSELEVAQVAPPQVFSHGGARPQTKGFAAATAEATGQSKRQQKIS